MAKTDEKKDAKSKDHGAPDDIRSALLQHRRILLNGPVDESVIEDVVMQLELLNLEDDERMATEVGYARMSNPIIIYINSPGGYCVEGLALISAIEQSATPVYTVAVGRVASMGLMIFAAGHYRISYRHAELMYHQVSYGAWSDKTDIERRAEQVEQLQQRMDAIFLERTKVTKRKLKEVHEKRIDWYMYPEEAVEIGLVDAILEKPLKVKAPKAGRGKSTK